MISNYLNCHLSKAVTREKGQSKERFIEERKRYFEENIRFKETKYKGLPVYLAKRNEPNDACFNKFAIGKEEFHKTRNIDMRRLERFDWMFEIIDRIDICKKCRWIKIYPDKNYDNRLDIECLFKKYKLVIVMAEHTDHYEILTAFYKRT